MNVCMIQSYSKNNQQLFNLTIGNHIKYCNIHEFSFLTNNESYTPLIRTEHIKNILKNYDLVFTIGSDVLITNLEKNIIDFLDKKYNFAICKEGHAFTLVNGEILFFWNNKETFDFLDEINEIELKNQNIFHGFQGIVNNLVYSNDKLCKQIQLIDPGLIQKYLYSEHEYAARINFQNYLINSNNIRMKISDIHPIDEFIWRDRNDFCLHTLGGSNEEKFNNILKIILQNKDLIQFL